MCAPGRGADLQQLKHMNYFDVILEQYLCVMHMCVVFINHYKFAISSTVGLVSEHVFLHYLGKKNDPTSAVFCMKISQV